MKLLTRGSRVAVDTNVLHDPFGRSIIFCLVSLRYLVAFTSDKILWELRNSLTKEPKPALSEEEAEAIAKEVQDKFGTKVYQLTQSDHDTITELVEETYKNTPHFHGDLHVVQFAVSSRCHAIITFNIKHFPKSHNGIISVSLDQMLTDMITSPGDSRGFAIEAVAYATMLEKNTFQEQLDYMDKKGNFPLFMEKLESMDESDKVEILGGIDALVEMFAEDPIAWFNELG